MKVLNKAAMYWKCWSQMNQEEEESHNPYGFNLLQLWEKEDYQSGCCSQDGKLEDWNPRFWLGQSKYVVSTDLIAKYPYMAGVHDIDLKQKGAKDWSAPPT